MNFGTWILNNTINGRCHFIRITTIVYMCIHCFLMKFRRFAHKQILSIQVRENDLLQYCCKISWCHICYSNPKGFNFHTQRLCYQFKRTFEAE
jgi:hypothetical protein